MGGPLILRIVFRKEFSNLSGVLGRVADSNSIPKNQPTTFHRFWNSTAEIPSLTLRTARSAMPFDSDRCGVDVR